MSHRFVKENFGCHCFYNDSSFKRYNRAHSGGDTLIFNFNNGCGGYMPMSHCYGGFHGFGGFWGGFGAGFGSGLMNLGLGFLGGMCGLSGGMGSWFGGMGNWLGGLGCMLGNMIGPKIGAGKHHGKKLISEGNSAASGGAATATANTAGTGVATATSSLTDDTGLGLDKVAKTAGDATDLGKDLGNDVKSDGNNGNIDINTLDVKNIAALSDEDIADLDKAKLLNKLGIQETNNGLTLPQDISSDSLKAVKKIADVKGLKVAVANNPQAGVDKWIAGTIDNINTDEDGNITYTVNCTNVGEYGYKYTVKGKDNDWTIDLHSDSENNAKGKGLGHKEQNYKLQNGVLYRSNPDSVVSKKWYK